MRSADDVTGLLLAWRQGEVASGVELEREVYASLKRMASSRWRQGGKPATLTPSELVNEAVARLLDGSVDWASRAHFFALTAMQMRAVMIDRARARNADKRGGGAVHVDLDHAGELTDEDQAYQDILELDLALCALAVEDPRAARAVELTYFGGMRTPEVAVVLGVGQRTVEKDLAYGRAALRSRLSE